MSLARKALPSSRILHASLTEANNSRFRISSSVKFCCGMPSSAVVSLMMRATSGSGCGGRWPAPPVAVPALAGLLAEPAGLDDAVGDRRTAVVRVLRLASLPYVVADI